MEMTATPTQEVQTIERQFADIQNLACELEGEIISQEQYEMALMVIDRSKTIKTKWVGVFESIRAAQVAALDVTYATINKLKNPCEMFVKNLTPKCFAWEKKQEALARAKEIELQAKAKKEAEDLALKEAAHHHENGRPEVAESILSAPAPVIPVIHVSPPLRTNTTLKQRITWKARVVDMKALLKAVCDGTAPSHLIELNQSEANKLAAALKGEMKIPGIESYQEGTYSSSR